MLHQMVRFKCIYIWETINGLNSLDWHVHIYVTIIILKNKRAWSSERGGQHKGNWSWRVLGKNKILQKLKTHELYNLVSISLIHVKYPFFLFKIFSGPLFSFLILTFLGGTCYRFARLRRRQLCFSQCFQLSSNNLLNIYLQPQATMLSMREWKRE